ncbi:unnamed protein product, partial [Effrenium voratum]
GAPGQLADDGSEGELGIADGLGGAFARTVNADVIVRGQVCLIYNNASLDTAAKIEADYADFLTKWRPPPAGQAVKYVGSTTGSSYNDNVCSPAEVNWHVDLKCCKLSAQAFDRTCQAMYDEGLREDLKPKGSRPPVDRRWVADVTFPLQPVCEIPASSVTPGKFCSVCDIPPVQLEPFEFEHCKNVSVGNTYEFHWVFSTGAPLVGLRDDGEEGQLGITDGLGGALNRTINPKVIGVRYMGSTTGDAFNDEVCSPIEVNWHVDTKCCTLSAQAFDRTCKAMYDEGLRDDLKPKGSRAPVSAANSAKVVFPLSEPTCSS